MQVEVFYVENHGTLRRWFERVFFPLFRASFGLVLAVAGRSRGQIRLPRPRGLLNAMVIAQFDGIFGCFRGFLGRVFELEFLDFRICPGWG